MIKILVDAHCFDGTGQGMVSYLQGIYSEIVKDNNFNVTFACTDIEKLKNIFGQDINVVKIPYYSFLFRLGFFFPYILKTGRYDFVHFQYNIPFFLNKKVKYITTIHDIIPIDFKKYYSFVYQLKVRYLFKRAAKRSNIVLTVSEYSKKRIAKKFNIDENKIFVTRNAVKNIFVTSPISVNKELMQEYGKYFLYVSRIEERKNHLILLKAFVNGKFYDSYSLLFVGSRSSKTTLLYKYYNSLSSEIKQKIIFLSGLSDEELSNLYRHAEIFIYPSIAEGFGIPPLEAAMYCRKVICSNTTAMRDFKFFEKYSFDPLNEYALINQIKKILVDEEYPAEKIKKEILEQYSWKESAEILKKLILSRDI